MTPARAESSTTSFIVELQDDAAVIYKAKIEKNGGSVSQDQLQAYRSQLMAKQDQFLNALNASGVDYSIVSRNIKNYDGTTAATIPHEGGTKAKE